MSGGGEVSRPLTIGVDGRAAAEEIAGRGRVVRELLRALAARDDPHRYRIYARSRWEEPLDERFEWTILGGGLASFQRRAMADARRSCDVVLAANSYLSALLTRLPTATIIYDLVAFDPATPPPLRSRVVERLTLGRAVRRSAALLAISQATADLLAQRFPAAADRLTVMPLGVSPALAAPSGQAPVPDGFVLAVGTLEPRKNFPRLVEAYRRLPDELQRRHPLVVVGRQGWGTEETMAALRSLGDRCHVLGAVDDAALAGLYERCAVFCYPSLAEGFGLPVLEAMAAGAAVLTSDRSSLPEVGGDAVAYADPTDTAALAAGLEELLRDPARRAELGERARARAATFSWEHTAQIALDALERIAPERQASRGA
jgi:glycosyltransferase involved in cell wall biosynthesis